MGAADREMGASSSARRRDRNSKQSASGSSDQLGETGYRMAELNRNLYIYPNLFVMDNNATALRVIEPTAGGYMDVAQYELAPRNEDQRSDGPARELRDLRGARRARDAGRRRSARVVPAGGTLERRVEHPLPR